MKKILIIVIRMYQKFLSPDQGYIRFIFPLTSRCVMHPSCSQYAIMAIERYGTVKGLIKAIRRIGRCHPFQRKLIDFP